MDLTLLLDLAADAFGDRVVVGPRQGGLTAGRLRELAAGGAEAVRAAGADAIVYGAVNGPAFPVALFAAAFAGVPLVPVNYRLGAEQLAGILAAHPGGLLVADDDLPGRPAAVSSSGWLATAAEHAATAGAVATPTDAPAAVIYTSGTTSAPKGVLLRHENLVSYVLGTVDLAAAGPADAALMSVPPYHIAAVSNTLTNLFAGRRVLVLEAFDPVAWLELVRREEVTQAMVVPTMLARLLDADVDRTLPSLRSLAYGGAPMPQRVVERALHEWPHVDFVNAYGLTETSSSVTVLGPAEHRAALAADAGPEVRARLTSAGRPVPGIEVEVRDELGDPVPAGTSGLIWVRGAQVSGEYAGSGPAVDERGFFCTRDLGHCDAAGYLFVEGRVDDTIIRGAENIAPAEVEVVLLRHPDVTDAVVVGVPDEEWGQRIEAVVVVRPGSRLTAEELRTYARAALRGSRTPDRIAFWAELPRTVTGKLLRREVVAGLAAGQPVEIR